MARADLIVQLIHAGSRGDARAFREAVEALAAEERANRHVVLANRMLGGLATNGAARSLPAVSQDETLRRILDEIEPRRRLDELHLPPRAAAAVRELVEEQQRADLLRSHGLEPRNRVLLAGPAGNGKTTLAEALAHELMLPLVRVRYDGLIGSFLGETAGRLRRLFEYARGRRCVLFLDEFDTVGKERGDTHETGEIKRVVSSLLMQIDELPTHVIVVTATNHPELLDRAVWRRFQLRLELPVPGVAALRAFLAALMARTSLRDTLDAGRLARALRGASFAEAEELATDVLRRVTLALPEPDVARIVADRLAQWAARYAL